MSTIEEVVQRYITVELMLHNRVDLKTLMRRVKAAAITSAIDGTRWKSGRRNLVRASRAVTLAPRNVRTFLRRQGLARYGVATG